MIKMQAERHPEKVGFYNIKIIAADPERGSILAGFEYNTKEPLANLALGFNMAVGALMNKLSQTWVSDEQVKTQLKVAQNISGGNDGSDKDN